MKTLSLFGFTMVLLCFKYAIGFESMVLVGLVMIFGVVYRDPKFRVETVLLFDNGRRYTWPNNRSVPVVGSTVYITSEMCGVVDNLRYSSSMDDKMITRLVIIKSERNE